MIVCDKCGNTVVREEGFCRQCGNKVEVQVRATRLWYLAPVLFSLLGGGVAYLILRNRDKRLAKNCLKLGAILFAVYFVGGIIFGE